MVTIYLLSCEKGKYYVGKSNSIEFRIEEHFKSNGSEWTKIYKPIKVKKLFPDCDSYDEDKYTIKYMSIYGINNVRGGTFSNIKLNKQEQEMICKMINGANDRCFLCGSSEHFISDCPEKVKSDLASSFLEILIGKISNVLSDHGRTNQNQRCFRCGREGHYSPDCYATTDYKGKLLESEIHRNYRDHKDKCFRCGREGHYSPDCHAKTNFKGDIL